MPDQRVLPDTCAAALSHGQRVDPKAGLRLLVDVLWLSGSMTAWMKRDSADDLDFLGVHQTWLTFTEDVRASFINLSLIQLI